MFLIKKYFIPLSGIFVFLISCNGVEQNSSYKRYFDLNNYFKQQADSLNLIHASAKKILTKNGKTETATFLKVNWKKELEPFMEVDINKPGWVKSYTTDTVKKDWSLIYLATDSSLPIKKIIINRNIDKIVQVSIFSGKKNNFYELKTEMNYKPDKGYIIKSSQKVRFVQPTNFEIRTEFFSN